jgi:hypothetical protein
MQHASLHILLYQRSQSTLILSQYQSLLASS